MNVFAKVACLSAMAGMVSFSAHASDFNAAYIQQVGEASTARQVQSGTSNEMSVLQIGSQHQARQEQQGVGNWMALTQNGAANEADILQAGNGQAIEIHQNGGPPVRVIQR